MAVFLVIGTISVTIFKIDAKVFDGFPLKFLNHSVVNRGGQPCGYLLFARLLGLLS